MRTNFPRVLSVTDVVSDLLLFSCLAAFYAGIVLAIASLLKLARVGIAPPRTEQQPRLGTPSPRRGLLSCYSR
jgi:hypothetical protein